MMPLIRLKKMVGESCGNVMCQNNCGAFPPSILAASYKLSGMDCRPARNTTMVGPILHKLNTINVGSADSVPVKNCPLGSPNAPNRELIKPKLGFSNQPHTNA